jgi:hypothetical protein
LDQHAYKDGQVHYRIYQLNPAGSIVSGEWIEADDEQQARSEALAFCAAGTPTVELWQGTRQLAVLACRDPKAA